MLTGNYEPLQPFCKAREPHSLPGGGGSEGALGIPGLKSPGAGTIQPSAVLSRDGTGFSKVMREIP